MQERQTALVEKPDQVRNEDSPSARFVFRQRELRDEEGNLLLRLDSRIGEESGSFLAQWMNPDISANNFFIKAKALVEEIRTLGNKYHEVRKFFSGLDYSVDGIELVELPVKVEDFQPIDDLDREELNMARLNTPFADFGWARPDEEDLSQETTLYFISHINEPELFVKFIQDTSKRSINQQLLRKVLAQACEEIQPKSVAS